MGHSHSQGGGGQSVEGGRKRLMPLYLWKATNGGYVLCDCLFVGIFSAARLVIYSLSASFF